jgi:hypothetical protein
MWLMPFMTIRLLVLFILSSIYLCLGSLHWEMRLEANLERNTWNTGKRFPESSLEYSIAPREAKKRDD